MMDVRTALYRHWDEEGDLLYIGISLSAVARLAQHSQKSHWHNQIANMTVEWFDSRADALNAEREAIQSERPKFNKKHNAANDNQPEPEVVYLDGYGVFLVRSIETKLFQGIFWASSKADLWDTFDQFGDPYGYEFARMEHCGALCHPGAGVEVKQWDDSEDDDADLSFSWSGFNEDEHFMTALHDQSCLMWEPFCAANEDYGLIARLVEDAA